MRFLPFVFAVAVALVSCGGGSSLPGPTLPQSHAPVSFAPSSGRWSASLGPWNTGWSGKLNAVAVDPRNASTIYVAGGVGATDGVTTDAGIYKTTNGGASWSAVNSGLSDTTVNALAIDARGTLLAATEAGGIARSTDGAQSWHQVNGALAVRAFAAAARGWYAAARDGVYGSSDGVTWTLVAATAAGVNALAVDGDAVDAGLDDGTIVRVRNGSMTALARFAALDAPPVVHAIAIDPADTRSMYATLAGVVDGTYTDALFHSSDAGSTWRQISVPAPLRGAQAIAFSALVPHRLYVAGTGLAYTEDGGATFSQTSGYGDARAIYVQSNDGLMLASDQGVAAGSYGAAFVPLTGGLPINIVRSVALHQNTLLVTMQDFPPERSTDGGATWQAIDAQSGENGTAFINPNASNLCYVVDEGVSVSTDGCATFTRQAIGDHLASTQPIATDPKGARTYVLTASGAYVANDGISFVPARWEVPNPVDVALDPNDGQTIFTSSMSGGARVWRSTDGGRTFMPAATLTPPGPSYPNDVPVLAVDPSNSNVVIAVTETAVYRSVDRGRTFTALHQTYAMQSGRAAPMLRPWRDPDARNAAATSDGFNIGEHVAFVATPRGSMLMFSTSSGAYASLDDGTTIAPVTGGAISHVFEGFAYDAGRICAGTDGQGVVCSDPSTLASALR